MVRENWEQKIFYIYLFNPIYVHKFFEAHQWAVRAPFSIVSIVRKFDRYSFNNNTRIRQNHKLANCLMVYIYPNIAWQVSVKPMNYMEAFFHHNWKLFFSPSFSYSLTISQFNGIVVTKIIIRFVSKFHCSTHAHTQTTHWLSERAQQNNYAKTSSIMSINGIQLTFSSMLSFHIFFTRHISPTAFFLSQCHSFASCLEKGQRPYFNHLTH